MKKVIFQTLGCKVNQYETQGMREKLLGTGFTETRTAEEADLLVLNTCTVTGQGDNKSRYLIRRMHRVNPKARILVTGCYAEKNRDEIASVEGVTEVLGQNEKGRILETAAKCFELSPSPFPLPQLSISDFEGHARAFVKIQDGCNHACSFCKVVLVRGRSRSRDRESVIEEAKRLARAGFREIVLTGIQLGAYGQDLGPRISLTELMSPLLAIPGLARIRLSSIEPRDVTDDLIRFMKSSEKFCPHLHIPLQSGDDVILKRMRRRYTRNFYRERVTKLRSELEDFALTLDVMCGFPGETEEQFQNTLELLEELGPLKIHAFPYSRRDGTLASRFDGEVPSSIIEARMNQLRARGGEWQRNFLARYVGKTVSVLVEEKRPGDIFRARTSNYVLVEFKSGEADLGDIVDVTVERVLPDRVFGILK